MITRRDFIRTLALSGAGLAIGCGGGGEPENGLPEMPFVPYNAQTLNNYMVSVLNERNSEGSRARIVSRYLNDVRAGNIVYVPLGDRVRVQLNKYQQLGEIRTYSGQPVSFDPLQTNLYPYEMGLGNVPKVPGKAGSWIKGKASEYFSQADKWIRDKAKE